MSFSPLMSIVELCGHIEIADRSTNVGQRLIIDSIDDGLIVRSLGSGVIFNDSNDPTSLADADDLRSILTRELTKTI